MSTGLGEEKDKLKGSIPLVAVENVTVCNDSNRSMCITGPFKHPMVLQALSCDECQQWVTDISQAASEVHQEFAMIKYARGGKAIPHERVFRLDNENLHIMWKKRGKIYGFNFRNSCEWGQLCSLDLICDSPKAFVKWKNANVLETQCGMNHEERLVFNSFLMLFDSLNEQARLLSVYATYARSYPHLGLSPEEFQAFLAKEQKESLSLAMCAKLIYAHDKLHTMFKRKCAGNDPDAFKRSKHFLSLHGFISFLRSQDNSIVKPEHNKVYQDMDQPLSDYFINSSHNTYLTGHQLKGLSSLEAYVRALLQGCRCIELDIWDGPDEPIITHGRTLTSKIRFRDVVQIIKEYAFEVSEYPLILSLENHCNIQQQAQMAEIFLKDFGDMLVTQDFCRGNVLPSPNALKRRIILKGKIRIKKKIKRAPPGVWSPPEKF
ncbi:predicted protein [Nematostella vectensis]|uniref:Phosphoinositide phospholipase C n=1 Tax=Nematostella vectensis TaxID=45351 RepID=A7RKT2_NEMVE|nr:predicted protein [Nematostella vectensis]|eukprot:XP_001640107.1 predicted protein [Nematostella vectensis]